MAYGLEGVSTHPDRRINRVEYKYFATRCYSDDALCKFLDICENNKIPVCDVVAMGDDLYLVLYRWRQYINATGENIK